MYKKVTFALLREGIEHLNDEALRARFQSAADEEHSWQLHGSYVHVLSCNGRGNAAGDVIQGRLADYWDRRCSSCPNPLKEVLGKNQAALVTKAATLVSTSRIDPATASYHQTQLLQEALGGPVRSQPGMFSQEMVSLIWKNFVTARTHLMENVGRILAEHAAIQVAAPRSGSGLYSVPDGDGIVEFYQAAHGHWRREKSGEVSSALEAWREASTWDHKRDQYAVGLYQLLDERYEALLTDTALQTVAVPERALKALQMPLLAAAVRMAGRYMNGHHLVETLPVVATYLQDLGTYYAPVVNFGAASAEDTDAVLETAVTLHVDSLQRDDEIEASALLETARMLN